MRYSSVSSKFPESWDRLFAKVSFAAGGAGCWIWEGAINSSGYGNIMMHGRTTSAHRVSWHMLRGEMAEGMYLDHLCRNRRCVNPDHLEPVTQRENTMRGNGACAVHARKTHCKNGHEFTPENTDTSSGHRTCRACVRARRKPPRRQIRTVRRYEGNGDE